MRLVLIVGAIISSLYGCATPRYQLPNGYTSYTTQTSSFDPGNASHIYSVTAIDTSKNPVKGAAVEWQTNVNGERKTHNVITDDNGVSSITLSVQPELRSTIKWADYKSEAKYTVKKDGYYTKSGSLSESSYRSGTGGRESTPKLASALMVLPVDYLESDFSQAKQYSQLRGKVLDFLTLIRLESILNQSDLRLHGVRIQDFKGKRYLTFELDSDNVFNSLKLDRYTIGKQVFDETVRKILNPLNDKISDQRLFYGYNIIVNTKTKSFADKYATGDTIKYEFFMPQTSVRSYKDKNISGQKLIDDSIVLLNDERIDLKFQ